MPHPPPPGATPIDELVAGSGIYLESELGDDLDIASSAPPVASSAESGVAEQSQIQLIDEALQEELLKTIRDAQLYRFGRFDTSDADISLSWVPMGPLMNEGSILSSTINEMARWLRTKIDFEDDQVAESTLLIGLDCWGAVIASQVSVQLGVTNLCVAERGGGEHYVAAETLVGEVFGEIRNAKNIILISDVVATGLSLRRIYSKICDGAPEARNAVWMALSVICDEKQHRSVDCAFLATHGTACRDLRMPILSSESLPSDSILPPLISFK